MDEVRLAFADELVRVVGVSHYQPALRSIAGAEGDRPVRYETQAELVPEPTNPHDENAIQVVVAGSVVGYLSREDAMRYGPGVRLLREHDLRLVCKAVLGGRGRGSETSNLGVFLELPRAPEAVLEAQTIVRARGG